MAETQTAVSRPEAKPPASPLAAKLKIRLDEDQLTNCMRCGFCLPACPTFRETGIEAESPRGRIALMKAVADGLMDPDEAFEEQMNHCLGCRACEPACPADVKYGQLIEQARDAIEDHTKSHRVWVKGVRRLVFKELFPKQGRMKLLGGALKAYQKSGLQKLARGTGALKLLPKQLSDMEEILPSASGRGVVELIGDFHPAKGTKIATVGMFRGCLMDTLFTETNVHTVELLTEAGFEVVIPKTQNCCGALHAHSGEAEDARELARRNIRAFKEANVDYIVSNAGGCGAILVEYDHLLHDDPAYREDAEWFAKRVKDISDMLVSHGRIPAFAQAEEHARSNARADAQTSVAGSPANEPEACSVRITYQDSCHLRNVMRSSDAPRKLMRQVPGAEFVEMFESDRCCGSAGIYNLTQPEMANRILEHKMEHANATQAHYLLTSNPGCLLQMKLGVQRHGAGTDMKVAHVVDFLHERMAKD
ncbi:heterodisulfide reductase-related iron-sulfur binding cluster [Cohnella algarum]|uniref:heterodisulfide reductase-related iron-sulfur binding cluster n=1 Tax=Cohnella algarum TaxID=2044859 RepID=UPI001967A986|nr:(Fe-S)-binding protein [Cohnella algarum]